MNQEPPVGVTIQPYYVRHRQDWAVSNERQRHIQALLSYGESALFTLLWRVEDYEAGLVTRCPRCFVDPASVEGMIADVYKQPLTQNCPVCYGTTFGTGIRAQIIRPAIFTDADEDERKGPRGVLHAESLTVETTDDFRSRTGDYVFRADGSRYQLSHPRRLQVRTGYEQPTQLSSSLGYASIPANRQDESMPAFSMPPGPEQLPGLLTTTSDIPETPRYEILNGPLIPGVIQ